MQTSLDRACDILYFVSSADTGCFWQHGLKQCWCCAVKNHTGRRPTSRFWSGCHKFLEQRLKACACTMSFLNLGGYANCGEVRSGYIHTYPYHRVPAFKLSLSRWRHSVKSKGWVVIEVPCQPGYGNSAPLLWLPRQARGQDEKYALHTMNELRFAMSGNSLLWGKTSQAASRLALKSNAFDLNLGGYAYQT